MKKLLSSLLLVLLVTLFVVVNVQALENKWISYHFCGIPSVNWHMLPHDVHHYSPCGNEKANKPHIFSQIKQDTPIAGVPDVLTDDSTHIAQDESKGNPGNDKPVGRAGEKCDKGMCENSDGASGEHGKSNND